MLTFSSKGKTGARLFCALLAVLLLFVQIQGVSRAAEPDSSEAEVLLSEWIFSDEGNEGVFPATGGVHQDSSSFRNVGGYFEYYDSDQHSISYQGWDNGKNKKYWLASLSTKGYGNIALSSQQTSSGTGPRDFKVQYSTDNKNWTDVPELSLKMARSSFNCPGNSCKLDNAPLPAAAENQDTLYIRWIVSSNTNTKGSQGIGDTGSSLIKDIRITGTATGTQEPQTEPKLINMTLVGDTKTSRSFAWYTDVHSPSVLQVVEASKAAGSDFPEHEALTFQGTTEEIATYVTKSDRKANKKKKFYSHKVAATALTPGTTYRYRVGSGAANSWSRVGSFTTDTAQAEPFRFIAGADSQASSKAGFEPWADTFRKALQTVGDPKFILNAGDLVDNGDLEEQWQWMLGLPQEQLLNVPIVPVLGGHEVQDYDGDETTPNSNFYNHFHLPKQVVANTHDGSVYSFEYGNALFLIFNTQYAGELSSNGSIKKQDRQFQDQVEWMKYIVAKSDAKWKFVALHKGPYSAGDNAGEWEDDRVQFYKKALVPAFDQMGIDLVFEAHDHMYMRSHQMLNDKVVPPAQITFDAQGNAVNPKGTVYLMSNAFGDKFYTKYPGYDDYFAAINEQPFKKMFTDVSVSGDLLKIKAYTAAKKDESSGNNGVKKYDEYGIKRTDSKPDRVSDAKIRVNVGKATISWKLSAASAGPVQGFRIYEANGKIKPYWNAYVNVESGKTDYSLTVNDINAADNYTFVIRAAGSRMNSEPVELSTD
ncbi:MULTISPECIES: metallophosphoesterase family protein [Paenibacillus]|uniref:metallophosphoesterase family protein n=1 Tax=Paenibacillus TaxID=44249 RepID=UPI002FE0E480